MTEQVPGAATDLLRSAVQADDRPIATAGAVFRVLTAERLRRFAICLLVMNVGLYAIVVALGHFPIDALHTVIAQDFLGHRTGGILVATGRRAELYDIRAQYVLQLALVPGQAFDVFISPPLVAYLYAPFAFVGFRTAAALWFGLSTSLLAASGFFLARLVPSVTRERRTLLFLLAASSHPAIQLLGAGQDTAISLLLWSSGVWLALRNRPRDQWLCGAVFSLGLFKPQLFVLPPVLLLLLGRRRALLTFTAGIVSQIVLTLAVFGTAGPRGWLQILRSPTYVEFLQAEMAPKMTSLMPFLHSLAPAGWGEWARVVGAMLSAALVVAAIVRMRPGGHRGELDERAAWALACVTTLIASPHMFYYDLTLLVLPVALLLEIRVELSPTVRYALVAAYVLCWLAPLRVVFDDARWPINVLNASWLPIPLFYLWRAIPTRVGPIPELAQGRARA